jgi:hypothetical protein
VSLGGDKGTIAPFKFETKLLKKEEMDLMLVIGFLTVGIALYYLDPTRSI